MGILEMMSLHEKCPQLKLPINVTKWSIYAIAM